MRTARDSIPIMLVLLLMPSLWSAEGGRLRAAGDELRSDDEDDRDQNDHAHHHHDHHHGNSLAADLVADLAGSIFVSAFATLRVSSVPCYHSHPYDRHHRSGPEADDESTSTVLISSWNGHLALLGGGDGDDLRWLGADARAISLIGLGLGGHYLRYREDVADDSVEAELFDLSLVWRGFERTSGTLDVSVGYLGFRDEISTGNGAHFGLDLTFFPLRPLVLHTGASWGGISGSSVQRYHLGAGATWRQAGFSLGYRWTDIGSVDLDGWEAQFRWWF